MADGIIKRKERGHGGIMKESNYDFGVQSVKETELKGDKEKLSDVTKKNKERILHVNLK